MRDRALNALLLVGVVLALLLLCAIFDPNALRGI